MAYCACKFGYEDWTTEAIPRIFYVGIGNIDRVKNLKRNKKHAATVAKFGIDRHIVFTSIDLTELRQWEITQIARYQTCNTEIGCNLTRGGQGSWHCLRSDETKRKLGAASKLAWMRPDYIAIQKRLAKLQSKRMKEFWADPEKKAKASQKMSDSKKKFWANPENKARMAKKISESLRQFHDNKGTK
jgi:hypothetical protein